MEVIEGMLVNRADLQAMARERVLDASALLKGRRWSFAYYVAGYAVECALKSCLLARMIHTGWVFQERSRIDECLTHSFDKLIQISGLTGELNQQLAMSAAGNKNFAENWVTITQWKVTDRYGQKTRAEAKALYAAITDDPDRVLPWIMKFW